MPDSVEIPDYQARPERPCMGCGKRDKSYRDQVTLPDGNAALYHADCHILITDCDVCKLFLDALGTDHSNDGLKDEKLVEAYEREVAKPEDKRAKIFTTAEAISQPKPAGASNESPAN